MPIFVQDLSLDRGEPATITYRLLCRTPTAEALYNRKSSKALLRWGGILGVEQPVTKHV